MVSPNAMPAGSLASRTQRYTTIVRTDEDALTRAIIAVASQYGRYGCRRITSLLVEAGWRLAGRLRSRAADRALVFIRLVQNIRQVTERTHAF